MLLAMDINHGNVDDSSFQILLYYKGGNIFYHIVFMRTCFNFSPNEPIYQPMLV